MTPHIDLRLLIDGAPMPLPPEVATMILALVDHREIIRKYGAGSITLTYNGTDQTIALSKLIFRAKVRTLT